MACSAPGPHAFISTRVWSMGRERTTSSGASARATVQTRQPRKIVARAAIYFLNGTIASRNRQRLMPCLLNRFASEIAPDEIVLQGGVVHFNQRAQQDKVPFLFIDGNFLLHHKRLRVAEAERRP